MKTGMTTSANGTAVLHYFESCRLTAYPDPATNGKPWTIGWGCTGPDVVPGLKITQQNADDRFLARLTNEFEPGVLKAATHLMLQGEFDAMVCLAYNIGVHAFSNSTLIRKFNKGKIAEVSLEFLRWDKANGLTYRGLTRRRHAEKALFEGKTGLEAIAIGAAAV